jgi:hypothetical protein
MYPRVSFLALLLALPQAALAANPFTADTTDLWWSSRTSGRGVNVIQQGNTIFATFFLYGTDGKAHWYVAPSLTTPGGPASEEIIFTGKLYETTGPAFSDTFNPAQVTTREVGTARFDYSRPYDADLSFTADGKSDEWFLERQTWAAIDMSGRYYDVVRVEHGVGSCTTPTHMVDLNEMVVTQSGSNVHIATSHGAPSIFSCNFDGTYSQAGRLSAVVGNFSCSDNTSGPFAMSELETGSTGILGRFTASVNGCFVVGNIGGTRDTIAARPADVTDLWWNPAESGWGVNLMQQQDTLFATFFVYGADRQAHWYVASGMQATSLSATSGFFTGPLYETTGPAFAASFPGFDPSRVTIRQVGTANFSYASPNRGALTYTVDGVSVVKDVVRQTWAGNDPSGRYHMTLVEQGNGCPPLLGKTNLGESLVTTAGSTVTIKTGQNVTGALCTYTGTYSQSGRLGTIIGNYDCGTQPGTFTMTNVTPGTHGLLASITRTENGCTTVGQIGGARLDVIDPPG